MKKLFSMLMMLCAIITFSACSSDDDGPTNECPISDVVVPSSAKIGSEVIVQGKGFTSSQKFFLSYTGTSYAPVELTDARVTSSGLTFTVPYTASEGATVALSVDDGDKEWKFGSMTLLAADSPVSAVSIPSQMPLLSEMTITGAGFAEGDEIGIKNDEVKEVLYMDTKVVDGGVQVTTNAGVLEGQVDVYLRRGNSVWKIGETYSYLQRVIGSITISDNYFLSMYAGLIGLSGDALKLEMNYDKEYALQSVKSNASLEWDFTYSGKTISFTGQFTGQEYTYTLDDNKRIVSSTSYDMYGDPVTYTWNYDADGYLTSITSSDKSEILSATYADNNMQAYSFGVDCGMDTDNKLKAYPATVEPAYLLNTFSWIAQKEDLFFGFLLNQNVKISSSILTQFTAMDSEYGSIEEKAKSCDVKSSLVADDIYTNTLTLTSEKADGIISADGGLYSNKVVVVYKTKTWD